MAIRIQVKVDAGDTIQGAALDMAILAGKTGFSVEANINGVMVVATPECIPNRLVEQYIQALHCEGAKVAYA